MVYTLPKLDYSYDALEPAIDARTMQIHHTKHHQTYVDKLNAALEGQASKPLEEVLLSNKSPAVQNNGGGHYNHSFFWKSLYPGGKGAPCKDLDAMLNRDLGGFEEFQKGFTQAALTRFGSGWAWLGLHRQEQKLEVFSMPNQDHPKIDTHTPLVGLDVWEHAYYLLYQNRRPDYVKAFFSLINWDFVNETFLESLKTSNGRASS